MKVRLNLACKMSDMQNSPFVSQLSESSCLLILILKWFLKITPTSGTCKVHNIIIKTRTGQTLQTTPIADFINPA